LEAASAPAPRRAGPGLAVGHLHLHVGGIDRALAFYRDLVGFQPTMGLPSAAFVAAGGYHHHLGLNTWRGAGVPPQPPGTVGLRHWTIVLPRAEDVVAVRDRLERAGAPLELQDDDVLTRDPWDMSVLFTPQPPAR
jgi:catechol 2,3-dioxygenase